MLSRMSFDCCSMSDQREITLLSWFGEGGDQVGVKEGNTECFLLHACSSLIWQLIYHFESSSGRSGTFKTGWLLLLRACPFVSYRLEINMQDKRDA